MTNIDLWLKENPEIAQHPAMPAFREKLNTQNQLSRTTTLGVAWCWFSAGWEARDNHGMFETTEVE